MAVAKLDRKQRWGLLIVAIWTAFVVVLAIASQRLVTFAFLGLVPVVTFPFRKRKELAGQVERTT